MPRSTFVEIPQEEQRQMLTVLRRARYGSLLALHILLLCAAGRRPTDIAAVLFCSRSSVYRTVRAYRAGTLGLEPDEAGRLSPPVRTTVLVPTWRRSLLALLKAPPRAYGWCRTRGSCATLAATLQESPHRSGGGREDHVVQLRPERVLDSPQVVQRPRQQRQVTQRRVGAVKGADRRRRPRARPCDRTVGRSPSVRSSAADRPFAGQSPSAG